MKAQILKEKYTVSIIDTITNKVSHTVAVGTTPSSVAYSPFTAFVNITGPNGYSQNNISLTKGQNTIITNPITTSAQTSISKMQHMQMLVLILLLSSTLLAKA